MSELANEIIANVPPEFVREFADEILGSIPAEKVKADLKHAEIGRVLASQGALAIEGLGQKVGEIDARTFFRWQQENPGCWQDRAFVQEFFRDNEKLRAPGWKPKGTNGVRHGMTFVGGEAVSNLKIA